MLIQFISGIAGVLLACSALTGCRHEAARPSAIDSSTISIGRGGGFAGFYDGYTINGDGKVYAWQQKGGRDSLRLLFTATRDSTHSLFQQLAGIGFDTLEFNHPGNLTYFIELKEPGRTHSVRWGEINVSVPDSLVNIYQSIQSFAESKK